jgi:hypothetical protein
MDKRHLRINLSWHCIVFQIYSFDGIGTNYARPYHHVPGLVFHGQFLGNLLTVSRALRKKNLRIDDYHCSVTVEGEWRAISTGPAPEANTPKGCKPKPFSAYCIESSNDFRSLHYQLNPTIHHVPDMRLLLTRDHNFHNLYSVNTVECGIWEWGLSFDKAKEYMLQRQELGYWIGYKHDDQFVELTTIEDWVMAKLIL